MTETKESLIDLSDENKKRVFDSFDIQHTGTLPISKLGEALQALNFDLTSTQLKLLEAQASEDIGSKFRYYDLDSFVSLVIKIKNREKEFLTALEVFASDSFDGQKRNGLINVAELRRALTTLGCLDRSRDPLATDEVETILKEAGAVGELIPPENILQLLRSTV